MSIQTFPIAKLCKPIATLCEPTLRIYLALQAKLQKTLEDHGVLILFVLGCLLFIGGMSDLSLAAEKTFSEADFDDTLIRHSVGNLFMLIEGAFGALIMVVAGLGAIISAAMGGYRAALGMLVVSVGAFILRALVSLFFGTDYSEFISNT